jgi:hypothetical protein
LPNISCGLSFGARGGSGRSEMFLGALRSLAQCHPACLRMRTACARLLRAVELGRRAWRRDVNETVRPLLVVSDLPLPPIFGASSREAPSSTAAGARSLRACAPSFARLAKVRATPCGFKCSAPDAKILHQPRPLKTIQEVRQSFSRGGSLCRMGCDRCEVETCIDSKLRF